MVDKLDCDVIIIGASLAGNYLTWLLSKSKYRIIVIEEHSEVGIPFQCAGILSRKLTELIDIPDSIILNQVQVAKLISPSGGFIKLKGDESPYIVDRVALDKFYYNMVKDMKNVTYLLNEKFKNFTYCPENWGKIIKVQTSKRELSTRLLIGCDGPLSSVASQLGIKNKVIYASQARVRASFNQDEAVMIFNSAWKELFAWIVPEGGNVYRIGLACHKKPATKFNTLMNYLKLKEKNIINRQGGIIPYGMMNRLAFDNVLLLGDAAGQVKATTGGGIIMLLTATKYANHCIENCLKLNKFTQKYIRKWYEKPCYKAIGRQLKIHYILRILLEHFSAEDFSLLFKTVKSAKIEKLISIYGDMDFPLRMIFKLLQNMFILKFLFNFLIRKSLLIHKIMKISIFKYKY